MKHIPFNKPYLTGNETKYLQEAVATGKISGNGIFTNKSQQALNRLTGARKSLLTTSCTDALEMSAILIGISQGDEVIMPSYTFVSTANAFILRGAKIVFADSRPDHPGMDESTIEDLITQKTRAIVAVHYAGVACNMGKLKEIANKHGLYLIEDAAQAIDSYFITDDGEPMPLGSIGEFGTLSFHETKNIQCGEGGALLINDQRFEQRAEIIWEKGTNRAAFWRGEIDKYGWVDIGSSFLPSELVAAFLFAQLEETQSIQERRKDIWNTYHEGFQHIETKGVLRRPVVPHYATNNGHAYYLVCNSEEERGALIASLKGKEIHAVFHYQSLHRSKYFESQHDGRTLKWADAYTDRLVRLPLHLHITDDDRTRIIDEVNHHFG
jgi:dTDP-4-amino-4,6-dideoxygalactose transaminase